jgi:integrase/recombinase XerD
VNVSLSEIQAHYHNVGQCSDALAFIKWRAKLQSPRNTLLALSQDLNDFLEFCVSSRIDPLVVDRMAAATYVERLGSRPSHRRGRRKDAPPGLSATTITRRLSSIRNWYEYLIEEGCPVSKNPFATRRSGKAWVFNNIPRQPWIPSLGEWKRIVAIVARLSLRNRCMFALQYDLALRGSELCAITLADIDSASRSIRIRQEISKSREDRTLPFSVVTSRLLTLYQDTLPADVTNESPIFLSESNRNCRQPISLSGWRKIIEEVRAIAKIPKFHSHTIRHFALTDLARAEMDVHSLMTFAGHVNLKHTQVYIHLASSDLARAYRKAKGFGLSDRLAGLC